MKRKICLMFIVAGVVFCSSVVNGIAADEWMNFSVQAAMESDLAKNRLDPAISFYMKGQKHQPTKDVSGEYTANKRARKFGKSAEAACQDAFVSALMSFQDRAFKEERTMVVDLYSVTKDRRFESEDQYSCLVGGMMVNVALRGRVANSQ